MKCFNPLTERCTRKPVNTTQWKRQCNVAYKLDVDHKCTFLGKIAATVKYPSWVVDATLKKQQGGGGVWWWVVSPPHRPCWHRLRYWVGTPPVAPAPPRAASWSAGARPPCWAGPWVAPDASSAASVPTAPSVDQTGGGGGNSGVKL